jgi:hypothetical protein
MLLPGGILGLRTRPTTRNRLPASPRTSKSVRCSLPTIPLSCPSFTSHCSDSATTSPWSYVARNLAYSAFTCTLHGRPIMYLISLPRNKQSCASDTTFAQLLHIWRLLLLPRLRALLYLPPSHQRVL